MLPDGTASARAVARPGVVAGPIRRSSLDLEPLRVEHADEAAQAFDDVALHQYTGSSPASAEELRSHYERQVVGRSPDGSQTWLNWMLRRLGTAELIGTVQATVTDDGTAEVAWIVSTDYQGSGYAREAAVALAAWLRQHHVSGLMAHVHPDHTASAGVARAIGLRCTGTIVDGEERWSDR
ncbi:GNAT family N-acetyltransferase [Sanguibacter suaedae]|uniref:GNAT family N-acetyltransferase n=1 Tax=Sanguibacter suaedae TaxID=2795737 RepID=A0A934M8M5_9MICO|nr:GNAT family N-acetyltransferase [Sanguibacter suaedae]MBI9113743.1 GNAT family N-acetyltransferase [Sanguibacter suaedae]